ncbi:MULTISPECIES: hypothetical protein [unclassified Microcoleus]
MFAQEEGSSATNRQDACSTKSEFSCGTGKMPVPKQVIENVTISQM